MTAPNTKNMDSKYKKLTDVKQKQHFTILSLVIFLLQNHTSIFRAN